MRRKRRSTLNWGDAGREAARLVPGVALAAIAFYLVLAVSIAGAVGGFAPNRALSWVPSDAWAQGRAATEILSADRSPPARAAAARLARRSLSRDPTVVSAMRALGTEADQRGDAGTALHFMITAQRLSRRDLATQIWLINHYYGRRDIPRLIGHFDIAMQSSAEGLDVLVPLLVNISGDPQAIPPIARALSHDPTWRMAFLRQLATEGPTDDAATTLIARELDPRDPDERQFLQRAIAHFVDQDSYSQAWRLYVGASGARAAPARLAEGFERRGDWRPFDWDLASETELRAEVAPRPDGRDGNALSLVAYNGRSGPVARRLLHLPAGRFRLSADFGSIPADRFDRPHVKLACARETAAAEALLDLQPPSAGVGVERLSAAFAVPADCAWQWLSIEVAGGGPAPVSSPWIDNVTIVPSG
jgi:hypothetical protein